MWKAQLVMSCVISLFKELSKKYTDCEFFKVDVDENTVIAYYLNASLLDFKTGGS